MRVQDKKVKFTSYKSVKNGPGLLPIQWHKKTIGHADLTTAAATQTIDCSLDDDGVEIPDGSRIVGAGIKVLRPFGDSTEALSALTVQVGDAGNDDEQLTASSVFAGGLGPAYSATVGGTATDGDYTITFTGFGLETPVDVDVTRSTTPASNDDLAAEIDAALDVAADASGSLEDILFPGSISSAAAVVSFRAFAGLPAGTVTQSAPAPGTLTIADVEITTAAAGAWIETGGAYTPLTREANYAVGCLFTATGGNVTLADSGSLEVWIAYTRLSDPSDAE